MSRIKNSQRNIIYGFAGQLIKIFTKFILRTLVIYMLGAVYLGLDGLFLNVISILSLAELGIGNAVCFALYKPLAIEDNSKINSYMKFYKKVYIIIGFVILLLGLTLVPFLQYLVNFSEETSINYYIIYIIFLLNSVVTYWFGAYRQVLFIANQQSYIIDKVNNIVLIISAILQTIALIGFKNYYLYLAVMIFAGVGKNLYIYRISGKIFPFLKNKDRLTLNTLDKKEFIKNVYALALTKISSTIYTSSDNLIISSFVGTIIVGYYSNYSYIISAISGFISIMFSSVLAGVGNINVTDSKEHTHSVFKRMLFINFWIYGFCFICFWQLLNPFIKIWAGDAFLFSEGTVFIISLLFLLPGLNHTCTIFRTACGLFWQTRYRTTATAIVNIIVSIILVQKIGLIGVFLGTIIAYFATIFTIDPNILYREVFKASSRTFYLWYAKSTIIIISTGILVKVICGMISITGMVGFILQMLVCLVITNLVFYMLNRRSEEFDYYKNLIVKLKVDIKKG